MTIKRTDIHLLIIGVEMSSLSYDYVENFLNESLKQGDTKIAIYPYGSLGKKVEKKLDEIFHITPCYIFDNSLYKTSPKVYPASLLHSIDYSSIDRILVCSLSFDIDIISSIPYKWQNKVYSISTFINTNREYNRVAGRMFRNSPLNIEMLAITNVYLLNKIKENEVRIKVKNKEKIRVMFLVDDLAKFKSKSVYRYMQKSEMFAPFVVVYKTYNVNESIEKAYYEEKHKEDIIYFRENGYVVYDAHNEDGSIRDFEDFSPDLIFTSSIAYVDFTRSLFSSYYLYTKWLVCYLNYGINSSSNYYSHFNMPVISSCWKHFEVLKSHFSEILAYSRYGGVNTKYLGNPFLDDYVDCESKLDTISCSDNSHPLIIYAPHWSIDIVDSDFNTSTFFVYQTLIIKNYDFSFPALRKGVF